MMGRKAFWVLCLLVLASCGKENYEQVSPGGDAALGGSAANLTPMGNFRVGSANRHFTQENVVQCSVGSGGTGSSTLEIAFDDQASASSMNINLVGYNPSNYTHQISGNYQQNSGGSIQLTMQGQNSNQSRYTNSANSKCDFQLAVTGDTIRGMFTCNQLSNGQRQSQKASGSFVCRQQQLAWR